VGERAGVFAYIGLRSVAEAEKKVSDAERPDMTEWSRRSKFVYVSPHASPAIGSLNLLGTGIISRLTKQPTA
jgi:hypothetical protein